MPLEASGFLSVSAQLPWENRPGLGGPGSVQGTPITRHALSSQETKEARVMQRGSHVPWASCSNLVLLLGTVLQPGGEGRAGSSRCGNSSPHAPHNCSVGLWPDNLCSGGAAGPAAGLPRGAVCAGHGVGDDTPRARVSTGVPATEGHTDHSLSAFGAGDAPRREQREGCLISRGRNSTGKIEGLL